MTRKAEERVPNLTLYRCGRGHAFFRRHDTCPACGEGLAEFAASPRGVLVSQTRVRVNPTRTTYRLGLAEVECGARTLCMVDGGVADLDRAPVTLHRKNDIYHALADPKGEH